MLVSSYNNQAFNDLLVVLLKNSKTENQSYERKGHITKLIDEKSGDKRALTFLKLLNGLS